MDDRRGGRRMNNDLISRSALKRKFRNVNEGMFQLSRVYELIDNAPTVQLNESVIQAVLNKRCMTAVANEYLIALHDKRPHGQWIKHIDNLYPEDSTEECPFCHEEQRLVGNDDNFCPNCGADMRGGRE
jgi:RNA polymerase subunit RPABC4/transcription elongation factor Spt4